MKFFAAALLTLSLNSVSSFADHGSDPLSERSSFSIDGTDESVEKVWHIHHPGLVRWLQDGYEHESYLVPGCFAISADAKVDAAKLTLLAESLDMIGSTINDRDLSRSLPLEKVNGTQAFVDRNVQSLYIAEYRMQTKKGVTFAQLYTSIFGEAKHQAIRVQFYRGCQGLNTPPFGTKHKDSSGNWPWSSSAVVQ